MKVMIGKQTFRRSLGAFAASCAISAGAFAQSADPSIGRRIAASTCSACHQVEANATAPSPMANAPSFVAISRMPSMNELAIKVFLRTSHAPMPNILLSAEEIDSMAAYILGLAGK